jgi:hypothetical protein
MTLEIKTLIKSTKIGKMFPLSICCGVLLIVASGCSNSSKQNVATTPDAIKSALGGPGTPLPKTEVDQLKSWDAKNAAYSKAAYAAHAAGKPLPPPPTGP